MNARTSRQETQKELITRLENSHWNRNRLVESVAAELDISESTVESILDRLEANGEVYVVNEEVKKT